MGLYSQIIGLLSICSKANKLSKKTHVYIIRARKHVEAVNDIFSLSPIMGGHTSQSGDMNKTKTHCFPQHPRIP